MTVGRRHSGHRCRRRTRTDTGTTPLTYKPANRRAASATLVAETISTLAASRLNTLLDAARPHRTAAGEEVRTRAKDLAAARPMPVAA